jgi:hypothetical protein
MTNWKRGRKLMREKGYSEKEIDEVESAIGDFDDHYARENPRDDYEYGQDRKGG